MTPEQEVKEREKFEKAWNKAGYNYSACTIHYKNTKFIAEKFWLERVKVGEEEIEGLKDGIKAILKITGWLQAEAKTYGDYAQRLVGEIEKIARRILGEETK